MELSAPSLIIDGFPVAVTSDMGYANDTSDMGTGVAERRAWTQAELERIARRARLGVTASRVGAAVRQAPAAGQPAGPVGGYVTIPDAAKP